MRIAPLALALAVATPAVAQDDWQSESRAVRQYKRDRLSMELSWSGKWYWVRDGQGRIVNAVRFASMMDDRDTRRRANINGKLWTAGGVTVAVAGGVVGYAGAIVVLSGLTFQDEDTTLVGLGLMGLGVAAMAGGAVMIINRRPRRPPAYYQADEAHEMILEFNADLRDQYGVTLEELGDEWAWAEPPRSTFEVGIVVSPSAVGVVGRF